MGSTWKHKIEYLIFIDLDQIRLIKYFSGKN